MKLLLSEDFSNALKKIKDKSMRERVFKALKKIEEDPEAGKPLQHSFKNYRRIMVTPYRIIYSLTGDTIFVNCFDHRGKIYKKAPEA